MSRYTCSLLLLCCLWPAGLWAQLPSAPAPKPVPVQADSLPPQPRWMVTGMRLGVDLMPLAMSLTGPDAQGVGLYADVMLNNSLYVVGEYGWATRERQGTVVDYRYSSKGNYWRIGVDYNLIGKLTVRDAITLGGRLARSGFSQQLRYQDQGSDYWGESAQEVSIEEKNLSAFWGEITAGFRVGIWKNFQLGFNVGMQLPISIPKDTRVTVNDVPGFGFSREDPVSRVGIRYYLLYRIPFKQLRVAAPQKP